MDYILYSNQLSLIRDVCPAVSRTLKNCVKQASVYFIICPKQGPKMEGVVLNRGGISVITLNFGVELFPYKTLTIPPPESVVN